MKTNNINEKNLNSLSFSMKTINLEQMLHDKSKNQNIDNDSNSINNILQANTSNSNNNVSCKEIKFNSNITKEILNNKNYQNISNIPLKQVNLIDKYADQNSRFQSPNFLNNYLNQNDNNNLYNLNYLECLDINHVDKIKNYSQPNMQKESNINLTNINSTEVEPYGYIGDKSIFLKEKFNKNTITNINFQNNSSSLNNGNDNQHNGYINSHNNISRNHVFNLEKNISYTYNQNNNSEAGAVTNINIINPSNIQIPTSLVNVLNIEYQASNKQSDDKNDNQNMTGTNVNNSHLNMTEHSNFFNKIKNKKLLSYTNNTHIITSNNNNNSNYSFNNNTFKLNSDAGNANISELEKQKDSSKPINLIENHINDNFSNTKKDLTSTKISDNHNYTQYINKKAINSNIKINRKFIEGKHKISNLSQNFNKTPPKMTMIGDQKEAQSKKISSKSNNANANTNVSLPSLKRCSSNKILSQKSSTQNFSGKHIVNKIIQKALNDINIDEKKPNENSLTVKSPPTELKNDLVFNSTNYICKNNLNSNTITNNNNKPLHVSCSNNFYKIKNKSQDLKSIQKKLKVTGSVENTIYKIPNTTCPSKNKLRNSSMPILTESSEAGVLGIKELKELFDSYSEEKLFEKNDALKEKPNRQRYNPEQCKFPYRNAKQTDYPSLSSFSNQLPKEFFKTDLKKINEESYEDESKNISDYKSPDLENSISFFYLKTD